MIIVVMEAAIMFEFNDGSSATLASEILQQLGYSPVIHDSNRVHIHMEGSDLTSALEIAQAYGGQLVEQSEIEESIVTNTAYSLDAIAIPAHVVNEDWVAAEERREAELHALLPEIGESDAFSGDVHA